ncbi:TVP38/TMEM64 family protein [Candidatus Bealeia paramacronuclearis]
MDENFQSFDDVMKKVFPFLLLGIVSWIIWASFVNEFITGGMISEEKHALQYYAEAHQTLCIFLYGVLAVLFSALAWPRLFLLALLGGFLFGPLIGSLVLLLSATLGSSLFFLLGREALEAGLKRVHFQGMEKLKAHGFWIILSLRFLPLAPFLLTTLLAATLNLRFRDYWIGTFLGSIPQVVFFTILGSASDHYLQDPEQTLALVFKEPTITFVSLCLSFCALIPIVSKTLRKRNFFSVTS